ncbi:hypothetical protein PLICRDRAFT_99331, partial [Plicaturopsis crispa FD-325 SS-3]
MVQRLIPADDTPNNGQDSGPSSSVGEQAAIPVDGQECGYHDTSHLEVKDFSDKLKIIDEWQQAMSTDSLRLLVCSVCGRKTSLVNIMKVPATKVHLELLRNDELPTACLPKTYDFELYSRAILNPRGLGSVTRLGDMWMCKPCYKKVVVGKVMPKYALSNWLYYGEESLPSAVRNAFSTASVCDKMLACRARSTKICMRVSELPSNRKDDGASGSKFSAIGTHREQQRYTRGNLMVMPQDTTQMNVVLPAAPEVIADNICAVFVGGQKPTRKTIRKLAPVLIRKSRVKVMIEFLIANNPFYSVSSGFEGFSQNNLDNLLEESGNADESDEGVPCNMEIGYIPLSDAVDGATSDYSTRNDEDPNADGEMDLVIESVGFTYGDDTPMSYRQMKARALTHCLEGKRFLQSTAGSNLVPDFRNPSLMSWLFPHLDPWGIGGFFDQRRAIPLTMEEQLKYLMTVDGGAFEKDAEFAFVYYNIIQKKSVVDSVQFKVPKFKQDIITRELLSVELEVLQRLETHFKSNPLYVPSSPEEKKIVSLLTRVNLVGHSLRGTAAHKVKLRNEIRATMNRHGSATLFITLNPSDVKHPIVRLLSGEDIDVQDSMRGDDLSDSRRRILVAENPASCALFFHIMVTRFLRVIARYGRESDGLFGKCEAYYGTVEAQGKGTLHLHLLLWLRGHPSPQGLRDRMESSDEYKEAMFNWLESIIKCELMTDHTVVEEPNGESLPRPAKGKRTDDPHPGSISHPVARCTSGDFEECYIDFVDSLVKSYNWHVHGSTCWKYLKNGPPLASSQDSHCRMRMNGSTNRYTRLDDATHSIILRRLHPRIAAYNDVVIFLMQCNVDVKFIGSGEAAKALLYYITDYITKPCLPTHVGLAAMQYAIQRTTSTMERSANANIGGRAVVTFVNSLMGRQEISHQQVMSYLVGGGDHYTSDKFTILFWSTYNRTYSTNEAVSLPVDSASVPRPDRVFTESGEKDDVEEQILLTLRRGSITASNQQLDYVYRTCDFGADSMCLYDFVGRVTKSKIPLQFFEMTANHEDVSPSVAGRMSSQEHPQFYTHLMSFLDHDKSRIPVILGARIPRADGTDLERESWARSMLILFKPWRHPQNLRTPDETWYDAYTAHEPSLSAYHLRIIENMNVMTECKD